ncbi:MAG: alkaline phosphatase [Desulfobacteraceae bacterium]|nr:MAG: alkaline phosphatase [Desulfobacteraceae bacterium]
MNKPVKFFLFCIIPVSLITGCVVSKNIHIPANPLQNEKAKNIILIIGDGMGPQELGFLLTYARQAPNAVIKDRFTAFDRLMKNGGSLGISMTYPGTGLIVDSASSATQLATGQFSGSEMIGLDKNGNAVENIIEKAKNIGKATGLVSDTRITHATPAGFAAHQNNRDNENEIAEDLLNLRPDVMLSGGFRHFVPIEANDQSSSAYREIHRLTGGAFNFKSSRKDSRNLLHEAQEKGYSLAFRKSQLDQISSAKLLGLFSESAMPYEIDYDTTLNNPDRTVPTLKEMTSKALDILSRNEKGFFLMVESGLIDWQLHNNDAGGTLHEMLVLNDLVEYVLEWTKNRKDTIVIVTGDHETGGIGLSYSAVDLPSGINLPGAAFKGLEFKPLFNYGRPEVLDKIYNQKISYEILFASHFDKLPKERQTPANLMELFNSNSEFPITEAGASRILARESNPFYVEGHKYLDKKEVPVIDDFKSFYVYQSSNRMNALAREVAEKQMTVWSTGTHTATPVLVFAGGPESSQFQGIMHHTQLAQKMIKILLSGR